MKNWTEDQDFEHINWYFRLDKCHGKSTCKTETEIDTFVNKLIITSYIDQLLVDFELDEMLNENWEYPFNLKVSHKKNYVL